MESEGRNAVSPATKGIGLPKLDCKPSWHRRTGSEASKADLQEPHSAMSRYRQSLKSIHAVEPGKFHERLREGFSLSTNRLNLRSQSNLKDRWTSEAEKSRQTSVLLNYLMEKICNTASKQGFLDIEALLSQQRIEINALQSKAKPVSRQSSAKIVSMAKTSTVNQQHQIFESTPAFDLSPGESVVLTENSHTSESNSRVQRLVIKNKQSQVSQLEKQVSELELTRQKRVLMSQIAAQKRQIEALQMGMKQESSSIRDSISYELKINRELKLSLERAGYKFASNPNIANQEISECTNSIKHETTTSTLLPVTGTVEMSSLDALHSPINRVGDTQKQTFSGFSHQYLISDAESVRKRLSSQTQTDLFVQKTKSNQKLGDNAEQSKTSGLTSMDSTPSSRNKTRQSPNSQSGIALKPVLPFELEALSSSANSKSMKNSKGAPSHSSIHLKLNPVLKEPGTHRSKRQTLEKIQESTHEDRASSSVSPGNATGRLLSPDPFYPKGNRSNKQKTAFELTKIIEIKKKSALELSSPESASKVPPNKQVGSQDDWPLKLRSQQGAVQVPATKNLIVKLPSEKTFSRQDEEHEVIVVRRSNRKDTVGEQKLIFEEKKQSIAPKADSVDAKGHPHRHSAHQGSKQHKSGKQPVESILNQVGNLCLKLDLNAYSENHSSSSSSSEDLRFGGEEGFPRPGDFSDEY